jgi:hypothetical protein
MAHRSVLFAEFGEDVPYAGGLERGFPYRGRRVPFLNRQKGIYRSAVQRGPAALSIQTSAKSPYDDEFVEDGFHWNRLNVAISRAKCLAYVVASPRLLDANCRIVEQMRLANALCRFVEAAEGGTAEEVHR